MGEIKIVQRPHIPGKVKISGPEKCLRMPIYTALSFAFTLGAYYALEVKNSLRND